MKINDINLLKVKSIITFMVGGVFTYLAITGKIESKDTFAIVVMMFTFYFAKADKTEVK